MFSPVKVHPCFLNAIRMDNGWHDERLLHNQKHHWPHLKCIGYLCPWSFPRYSPNPNRKCRHGKRQSNETSYRRVFEHLCSSDLTSAEQITSVLGTSGSGKTRLMFEGLCRRHGFYLTATKDDGANPGLADLESMRARLESRIDFNSPKQNDQFVLRYSKCLLVARIYCLRYILTHCGMISAHRWLMLQLHADDWMPHLFQSLWNIFVELHTEPLTNLLSDSLTKIAEELGDWVSMKFPLIIDEAQVLLNPDQVYASATNDSIRPSLLSMMFRAFKEFPRLRIFACGTKEIDETGGPSRLFKYRQDLIVQNGFDLDGVHHFLYRFPIACRPEPTELRWLVGRSRILCSFLERYIRTGNSSVKKFREEFTHSRVKGTIGYELQRRENPKLKTVKGVNIMKLIERCVIYYHLTGLPRPLRTEKHLSLFEIGAARLQRTDWRLEVKIEEPLIVAGALAYFLAEESPMSRQYELMADMRSNPSSLGTLWEQIVPSRLEGILKNARFDNGVPSRNWNILDPASANADPNVLIQISDPVDGPFLPDFLAQPNVKYFIPDICVGPDIVCFASPHENSNDVYMVLVQVKLRNELRRQESQDAMGTTNIRKTCYSRKTNKALVGEAYEESRQRVETAINAMNLKGILRLLVAYPANSHLHLANPNEIRKSERLPASISEDLGENEWLRILDGENA